MHKFYNTPVEGTNWSHTSMAEHQEEGKVYEVYLSDPCKIDHSAEEWAAGNPLRKELTVDEAIDAVADLAGQDGALARTIREMHVQYKASLQYPAFEVEGMFEQLWKISNLLIATWDELG